VPVGRPLPERDTAHFVGVGPNYFETMQIELVAGREFGERDTAGAPPVVVVNEALARRDFPNQQILGQRLSALVRGERKVLEIVGVVRDTSAAGLRRPPPPTVYVPYLQLNGNLPTTIVVRAAGPLGQTSAALHRLLQPRMPHTPVEVRPLSAQVEASVGRERLMATLSSAFGVLALTLTCVGLYGLLAYSVARRTREIAIRSAIGAPQRQVITMVLTGAGRPLVAGVVIGLPAAWAASRAIQSMLFGVNPTDATTISGAIAVLMAAALAAAYTPARRATRIDPMIALRSE
jgi:predicted permease